MSDHSTWHPGGPTHWYLPSHLVSKAWSEVPPPGSLLWFPLLSHSPPLRQHTGSEPQNFTRDAAMALPLFPVCAAQQDHEVPASRAPCPLLPPNAPVRLASGGLGSVSVALADRSPVRLTCCPVYPETVPGGSVALGIPGSPAENPAQKPLCSQGHPQGHAGPETRSEAARGRAGTA